MSPMRRSCRIWNWSFFRARWDRCRAHRFSSAIFFHWLKSRRSFDLAQIIHLKAGAILTQAGIPYAYEAHGILAQAPQNPVRQRELHKAEGQVLRSAAMLIATSNALAVGLRTWYGLSVDFVIVPNAGMAPFKKGLSNVNGPLVYSGSISNGKDLVDMIYATHELKIPLKVVGGTEEEWSAVGQLVDTTGILWRPRVRLTDVPEVLAGTRAGIIPTNFDSPGGEFSCPMKLFDYARCGLPVLSTALPSLQSLEVGAWCEQVPSPARGAWIESLKAWSHQAEHAEAARAWAAEHTWAKRAEKLRAAFGV